MAKTLKQIKAEVEQLSAANIDSDCRTVDWSELLGENCEGWRSYDAMECEECGKVVVLGANGEQRHCDIDPDTECSGYLNSDGPLMNYFYPADFSGSCEEAAKRISGCCCVVEIEGMGTGFALTGGGMDLSWDIAAAYVDNGLLPPAWIRLPRMGGMTLNARRRLIIEACKKTAELMAQRARWNVGDLEQLEKWMRSEKRKRKVA